MQERQVKIGDVVAWDKVPSGALVRDDSGDFAVRLGRYGEWVALHRLEDWCAFTPQSAWHEMSENGLATLIALGLTGQETAADLQRLAEVFEVREALGWQVLDRSKPPPGYEVRNTSYEDGDDEVGGYGVMIEEWSWYDGGGYTDSTATEAACINSAWEFFEEETSPPGMNPYSGLYAWSWYWGRIAEGGDIAERLYRAGWRPGMTADDAARMLADLAPGCPDGLGCELCFDQDDLA